jgi:hypothetical protein
VARELGLSDRTLQRRIIDDGATFRQLLLEARQELAHEYLNRPDLDITEVAFLLGYVSGPSYCTNRSRTLENVTDAASRKRVHCPGMFAGLFTALSIGIINTSACSNPLLRRAGPEPFTRAPAHVRRRSASTYRRSCCDNGNKQKNQHF